MITIGIIYISTGLYNRFWEGFYESVNSNFCVDANKNFYLFTDDKDMVARKLPDNVFPQLIEDRGWVLNVMRRSEFFLSIEEKLKENDFVFNLNSNYRAIAPIYSGEILPEDSNDGVSALCFDFYIGQNPDNFAYDRNPNSSAYIPLGSGKYYFQGGFYGGCTTEFLNMSRHIKELTEIDISRKIVPRFHDESYLNRYLLNHNPRIIGTLYAVAEQWNPTADSKGLLLDKDKWFSKNELENIKSLHTEPTLSFLIDDNLRSQPIAIINLQGGLGNQIFQYAMMVQLRKDFPNRRFYLNRSTLQMLECHQGYQLDYIFGVDSDMVVPENIIGQIAKIPSRYVRRIDEPLFCGYTPIKDSTHPVWLISGYRQSEKYFDDSVRENLIFDYTKLNEESKDLLEVIRKDKASVAIHIRRGDYVRDIRTYNLMGGICTKEYYSEAIKQFDADSNYYVFSDDIEWCKKNLPFPKALYISHNHGADSWQDMMLISACAHQVIANSSFSWWGAWLNDNLDKIVIAPESWFNNIKDKDLVPSSWRRIKTKQADKMYNDLTIVIPVRVDSAERLRNLNFVTDSLSKLDGIEIVILEADKHPKIEHIDNVRRIFVEDYNPLFYHTKYVNLLCSMVRREFIGVWDCDVIVPKRQIDEAITALRKGKADMFYPFDGRCYNVSNNVLEEYISTSDESILTSGSDRLSCIYGKHTCGGAFLANRNAFIEAGGDNEQFTGWGAEDLERYKRWEIRGYRVHRTEGAIYHLDHIRGANSRYYSAELKRSTLQALLESCREPGEFSDIYIPVFIFNLPQRDERREHIISQFALRPEFEPILIDACIHPIGAVGLWHSIVKAVMQAKERGDDVIILCEDDHIFTENYSAISFIRNIVEAAEQGCDILMGGVGGFGTAVPVAYSRYWVDWFWCTQFVVVYAHSFDKILEYDFKDTDTADGVLSALFTRKLTLYPFISRQQDFGYSDITLNNNRENEMSRLFNNATMRLSVIDNVSKAYRI